MDNLKEKQIKEAQIRKEMLIKKYNLKSEVFNLDKFKQNEKYAKIIEKCENENNRLVYHCILTYRRILNLLFVSKYEEDWENERPYESEEDITYVMA